MNIYIKGTKKAARAALATGQPLTGIHYSLAAPVRMDVAALPAGTVLKFWTKRDPFGTPIAKAYGIKSREGIQ